MKIIYYILVLTFVTPCLARQRAESPKQHKDVHQLPQGAIGGKNQFCSGEIDDLIDLFDGFSYSKNTLMGIHFDNLPTANKEQLKWLATANADPTPFLKDSHWEAKDVILYPYKQPTLADANQTAIGDCNVISLFGEMAYLYPDFIKHLIKQETNYSFAVKMFTPQRELIIVRVNNRCLCDRKGNILQVKGKNDTATWSTVLEKALMKWLQIYKGSSDIGGFGAELMTPIFTGDGRSFSIRPNKLNANDLQRVVIAAIKHGLLVNGGFTKSDIALDRHTTISGHGHTFLLPTEPDVLFCVRNPWGHGEDNHIMRVRDDGIVPSLIDLRIISPGIASKYFKPKKFKIVKNKSGVSN